MLDQEDDFRRVQVQLKEKEDSDFWADTPKRFRYSCNQCGGVNYLSSEMDSIEWYTLRGVCVYCVKKAYQDADLRDHEG